MPRDIKHGQSGKYILNLTRISKDLCVYQRNTTWYIRINKQPTWRDKFSCSLKTCDKEEAIRLAKEKYDELINEDKIRKQVRGMIFNEEDLILSTKQAAQGRIAEDKFKNLMMLKGYQVYAPVEDIWGIDFIVIDNEFNIHKVQVKSSSKDSRPWPLKNTLGIRYNDTCTHMAFISLYENKMWYVPMKVLENHTGTSISHKAMTQLCTDYEVFT
tara:strand:+ start:96 stop:737 length:642 start_codon:yes stop_codon:yes gene_type:complete